MRRSLVIHSYYNLGQYYSDRLQSGQIGKFTENVCCLCVNMSSHECLLPLINCFPFVVQTSKRIRKYLQKPPKHIPKAFSKTSPKCLKQPPPNLPKSSQDDQKHPSCFSMGFVENIMKDLGFLVLFLVASLYILGFPW